jgi:hypothetical protein
MLGEFHISLLTSCKIELRVAVADNFRLLSLEIPFAFLFVTVLHVSVELEAFSGPKPDSFARRSRLLVKKQSSLGQVIPVEGPRSLSAQRAGQPCTT